MSDYRCYFVNDKDQIIAVEYLVECQDDAEAGRAAAELIAKRTYHSAAEVWDRGRKVSKHLRESVT